MRLLLVLILISNVTFSQVNKSLNNPLQRPKLVVGLVVDQMRWDYLYRYYNRYAPDGGFKRMLNQGFSCENTLINYILPAAIQLYRPGPFRLFMELPAMNGGMQTSEK
jgi:hypothetical protein